MNVTYGAEPARPPLARHRELTKAFLRRYPSGCWLGRAPMARPRLPSTEYRECATPRRIGMQCTGCTGPKFPGFADRPLVRWAP